MAIKPAESMPARYWLAGVVCSVLPDADVLAFRFGIPYRHTFGHRGFSHSLLAAALLATIALLAVRSHPACRARALRIWIFFFLAAASHGLLDAMTSGGLGVAFFAPVDNQRYFFGWRPIYVSPLGISRLFSERGLAVLRSEALWIWIPAAIFVIVTWFVRTPRVVHRK
jgi:inner membrane protein